MKKVLVIQTAFLGDVILATALVEKLNKCFPEIAIDMLVREGNEGLLKNHPLLSEVLVWKKKSGKWSNLFRILKEIRKNNYDAVFNLQRFFSSGFLTAFSGAAVKSGFDKNPMSFLFSHVSKHVIGDNRHEISRNMELLAPFCEGEIVKPRLFPSDDDFKKVESLIRHPYVTMAPASVWFTKQLPEEKWQQMINQTDPSHQIYLLGGPGDVELCGRLEKTNSKAKVVNLAGKLNLLETAALMKDAVMNYVNDSGPLHIASAMNAPVTAFFCSTVPEFGFGPLSDQSYVIQTLEKLTCKPCGLHGYKSCPLGHFKCGTTILVPYPGKS